MINRINDCQFIEVQQILDKDTQIKTLININHIDVIVPESSVETSIYFMGSQDPLKVAISYEDLKRKILSSLKVLME